MNENDLKYYLSKGKTILKNAGIETYSSEAIELVGYITNLTKVQVLTNNNFILNNEMKENFDEMFSKRSHGMPLAYITKNCEFMSLDFYVDSNVLIPRQDTEILVENAIKLIKKNNFKNVLEIGTGSGCISVSLCKYVKGLNVTAVDISQKALEIAKKNAIANEVEINFLNSDLFSNVNNFKYDIIISNPPYIERQIIETLDISVKKYEPYIALDGKEDGLYFYKQIASKGLDFLEVYGMILLEIGFNQADSVTNILNKDFIDIITIKDLARLDRVVIAKKRKY